VLGLAINSSDRTASAALWHLLGQRCDMVLEGALPPEAGKADQLITVVERLLAEQKLAYADLDIIAVNRGPGSFTGIRSAVALGRGLALATELPVLGVTSHEALVARIGRDGADRPLLVALDARRGEVYAQTFSRDDRPFSAIEAGTPSAVAAGLETGCWRFAGSGAPLVAAVQGAEVDVRLIETPPIDAAAVALAAAARLAEGEAPALGRTLQPLYVRAPDAIPPAPLIQAAPISEVLA